ncbi:MAG: PAS domain-containing protein [Candidatus Riflebacteria bacterium]|nr:PAS domain-containing protein [Candidatus Riflebacteria bacterium]
MNGTANGSAPRASGIGFGSALTLFLALQILIPAFIVFDLYRRAMQAEKDHVEEAFFQQIERGLADKLAWLIEHGQVHANALTRAASQTAWLDRPPTLFPQVASGLMQVPRVRAVHLVASDGTLLESLGTASADLFRTVVRSGRAPVLVSSDGLACRVTGPEGSPYLCLVFDTAAVQAALLDEWKGILTRDPDALLLYSAYDAAAGTWRHRPIGGGPPRLASLTADPAFLRELNPRLQGAPKARTTFFLPWQGSLLGVFAAPQGNGMTQVVFQDAAGAQDRLHHIRRLFMVRIILAGVGMLLLAWVFSHLLGTPIRRLAETCRQIEAGEGAGTVPLSPFREMNLLGTSLIRMATALETRLESTNRELVEQHKRLNALFQSIPDAIYLLDPPLNVVLANPEGLRRLGLPRLPETGLPLEEPRASLIAKIFESPQGLIEELHFEPTRTTYKVVVSRLVDLYGVCFGYLVLERDISLEKEIDRMKSEFVSNVSHELRTPLTSIRAYTEMLLDGEAETDEQRREYLEIVSSEAERLTRLVNDVLDLSRIESGRQLVRMAVIDPVRVARHSCQVMERWAEKRTHHLVFENLLPETRVVADKDLFEQALLNLLSNAIKYTPPGGRISLTCRREKDEARFEVADTGIGLSEEDRQRVFQKFFRVENDLVKAAGGTGLGLVLVQEIARLHGGRVTVDSTVGKGSTFTLCLPLKEGLASVPPAPPAPAPPAPANP